MFLMRVEGTLGKVNVTQINSCQHYMGNKANSFHEKLSFTCHLKSMNEIKQIGASAGQLIAVQ